MSTLVYTSLGKDQGSAKTSPEDRAQYVKALKMATGLLASEQIKVRPLVRLLRARRLTFFSLDERGHGYGRARGRAEGLRDDDGGEAHDKVGLHCLTTKKRENVKFRIVINTGYIMYTFYGNRVATRKQGTRKKQ